MCLFPSVHHSFIGIYGICLVSLFGVSVEECTVEYGKLLGLNV